MLLGMEALFWKDDEKSEVKDSILDTQKMKDDLVESLEGDPRLYGGPGSHFLGFLTAIPYRAVSK